MVYTHRQTHTHTHTQSSFYYTDYKNPLKTKELWAYICWWVMESANSNEILQVHLVASQKYNKLMESTKINW